MDQSSDITMISAIENNLFSTIQTFGKWPRITVHDESTVLWTISDIPFPLFNSVVRAQMPSEEVESTIQALISEAKLRNVPLLWWIGPSTQPPDIGHYLEKHGFSHADQMPGMAVKIANLCKTGPVPGGLVVQQVKESNHLKSWSQVFREGFGMPEFIAEVMYDFMTYVDPDICCAYLGWLDGKPVATSLLILSPGIAGIYNVATIPEARRKGIGAVMTAVPLREAEDRGYRVGILQASEMGVGVYRSLGFQEYCKIDQYIWPGDLADQQSG